MKDNWSIKIVSGPSPLQLRPHPQLSGPVLRVEAEDFVADPFMVWTGRQWIMFVERFDADSRLGRIAVAVSDDALNWSEPTVVIAEPFHISYPHVFEWQNEYYMTPETLEPKVVRLYKAKSFPGEWHHVADLVEGPAADPTPFRHHGSWWMFTCSRPHQHNTLRLFRADELTGPWQEHPASPVVTQDARIGRPAGRVISFGNRLIRFAQDCRQHYGESLSAVQILNLTPDDYRERPLDPTPLLGPGFDTSTQRIHHVDVHRLASGNWIACIDSCDQDIAIAIKTQTQGHHSIRPLDHTGANQV